MSGLYLLQVLNFLLKILLLKVVQLLAVVMRFLATYYFSVKLTIFLSIYSSAEIQNESILTCTASCQRPLS